jgi:hypothetical protein
LPKISQPLDLSDFAVGKEKTPLRVIESADFAENNKAGDRLFQITRVYKTKSCEGKDAKDANLTLK